MVLCRMCLQPLLRWSCKFTIIACISHPFMEYLHMSFQWSWLSKYLFTMFTLKHCLIIRTFHTFSWFPNTYILIVMYRIQMVFKKLYFRCLILSFDIWTGIDSQMNNTGLLSPIPIPIQYSSLNQQYQYNPNTNTIPINFNDLVLFLLGI